MSSLQNYVYIVFKVFRRDKDVAFSSYAELSPQEETNQDFTHTRFFLNLT